MSAPDGYSLAITVLAGDEGIAIRYEPWLGWMPAEAHLQIVETAIRQMLEHRRALRVEIRELDEAGPRLVPFKPREIDS